MMWLRNLLLLVAFTPNLVLSQNLKPWVYACEKDRGRCVKKGLVGSVAEGASLGECKLTCDEHSTILPRPRSMELGQERQVFRFHPKGISWNFPDEIGSEMWNMLDETLKFHVDNLMKRHPLAENEVKDSEAVVRISFKIKDLAKDQKPKLRRKTSESYTLDVSKVSDKDELDVTVEADNYFGVRHGLETLFQLVEYDDLLNLFVTLQDVHIEDSPEYRHRGVLLDTSRNFMTKEVIKNIIDGMAHNKLNVFHWHIADSHSFPIQLEKYPETSLMAHFGAYGPDKIYTVSDVKEIVEYANLRGVRVIPEFDAPGHVGNGWQLPGAENFTVCVNKEPWYKYCVEPPCGQLNPFEDGMYNILEKIYDEYNDLFDSDSFHMGGDEVNMGCWNSSELITSPMKEQGIDTDEDGFLKVWDHFQNRSYNLLKKHSKHDDFEAIMWTSHMTWEKYIHYLPAEKYTIQMWEAKGADLDNPQFKTLFDSGHDVIMSNYDAFYLDCGYGAWVGEGNNWCSPYKGWQTIYENDIYNLFAKRNFDMKGRILGGEVCMWSEQVDSATVEGKIFPRASALAERLWSNPESGTWYQAQNRMIHNRDRLFKLGIKADRLQPEWCRLNEKQCYSTKDDPDAPPEPEPEPESEVEPQAEPEQRTPRDTNGAWNVSSYYAHYLLIVLWLRYN